MRLIVVFFVLLSSLAYGQTVCTPESRDRLDAVLTKLSRIDHSQKTMNDLTAEIGTWFLETPYVEKTLELPGDEKLVVNLTGLDCTTYLESVVTLARLVRQGRLTFEAYEEELELIRYQGGVKADYPSRLHYFSDWVYQNERKGLVKDITRDIGGSVYENTPSFMSANPQFYVQLSNPDFVERIRVAETAITSRTYYFIPKEEISSHESKIQSGDLVAITTSMRNLDVVHVGFAIEREGRIHLMHASSNSMKVEISEKPLHDYLKGNKSQSGIIVSRLVDPSGSL